jgi:polysaccharide deacetylase 2 family uncharacterized protein YibQ
MAALLSSALGVAVTFIDSDAIAVHDIAASGDVHVGEPPEEPPVIAVVLDDCGGNLEMARSVLSTDVPLTWAIIPNLKYSDETAALLREAGVPFLAHVPMQAVIDPPGRAGRRGLYSIGAGMSAEEVRAALVPILDGMEGLFGVNNHRGSRATSDRGVMDAVMAVLAERDLFFLDSRTSPESVAYRSAVEHGLNAAYNSYFLDNKSDRDSIAARMRDAMKAASRKGMIVAICHLRPETVAFLEDFAGEVNQGTHESGVRFITLEEWPGHSDNVKGEKR